MSWKDTVKKERMSDEHMDRLRALPSYELPQFDEDANPYDAVFEALEDLEKNVISQVESLLQKAQSAFMRRYDVNQASGIGMDYTLSEAISKSFEEITEMVSERMDKEKDRLSQRK